MFEVNPKDRVFIHSHFTADAFGHGGSKRTCQVHHLLYQAGLEYKQADFAFNNTFTGKISALLKGLRYASVTKTSIKTLYAIGRYINAFEEFIKVNKPSLVIWESAIDLFLLLAEVLHRHKIPFIALPHNIESLLPQSKSKITGSAGQKWLAEELHYLKLASGVFTISLDEKEVLTQQGITANYLPYYPCPEAEAFLLRIRSRRSSNHPRSNTKRILLLGTFYNGPTLSGYQELLNHIHHFTDGFIIDVAGFGSEMLRGDYSADNITFWGGINKETLAGLMEKADVAIVHQQLAAGALTRIPELLLAGVPVLANTTASRSTAHLQGITVYHDFAGLSALLKTFSFPVPVKPQRPEEEQSFTEYLQRLTH